MHQHTLTPPHSATAADPALDYADYQWQLDRDRNTGVLSLVLDGSLTAVRMPSELGEQVFQLLSIRMLAGPVLSYRNEDTWVFLVKTPNADEVLPETVLHEGVAQASSGMSLPLPTAESENARWINPPNPARARTPWYAVVSAVRRVLAEVAAPAPVLAHQVS